ncbi:MAG: HigA family addiction module antidote protein, partial [Candidatus Marinimicrobia bacterium]|nr:HigA family addiction module antidote protein [Candidatus Neomarinimicrobiota bacterium]
MSTDLQLRRELLSPPGDTLKESIDEIGMSQAELAERMGRPKEKINDIIKGREPITMNTAIKLERVLGIPVSFWMKREFTYREELARIDQLTELEKMVSWMRSFPITELKKMDWLPKINDSIRLSDELLGFFGIASPVEWEEIYIKNEISVAFRTSLANYNSPHAVSAWLRMGELENAKNDLPDFDKKKFKQMLHEIKDLVMTQPPDFHHQLKDRCHDCGVGVVYTQTLPKAPINGATRWLYGNPVIQLSDRFKSNDQFWFSFYHEAGHVLLHGKKEVFLENTKTNQDDEKEIAANEFALKYLCPQQL